MTPATWSFIELFMSRMIFPPSVRDYRGFGRIGGRFYANVSVSMSLEARIGISSRRFVTYFGPVLGRLPSLEEIPRAHLPRWKASRLMVPATFAMVRRVNANAKRLPQFLADSPARCDRLRAEISATTDAAALAALWPAQVRPLLVEAADMLTAAGSADGTTLVTTPGKLAALVGEADAALLLSGQQADGASLASLGPVVGLARLARGEVDRSAFIREYGHRGGHEVELSMARPAEDPGWPDDQLAARPGSGPVPTPLRPRCGRVAGRAAGGPGRGLGAAGAQRPVEGGGGAQADHALGAARPRPRGGQIRGRQVGVGGQDLGAAGRGAHRSR